MAGDTTYGRSRVGSAPERGGRLVLACLLAVLALPGCVTVAEHRKLEQEVMSLKRSRTVSGDPRAQLADTAAELDRLSRQVRELSGRLEQVQKLAEDALNEARTARTEVSMTQLDPGATAAGAAGAAAEALIDESEEPVLATGSSDEVSAYRSAYSAWRSDDYDACIDRFRKFLQAYPSSAYADDAAFWMADCHYKEGDFKNAVLRFDDVVRNYPTGNKAADALFLQGEALLKLGPGFHEAARRAFERVLSEYPDSRRAAQARRQLDMLAKG